MEADIRRIVHVEKVFGQTEAEDTGRRVPFEADRQLEFELRELGIDDLAERMLGLDSVLIWLDSVIGRCLFRRPFRRSPSSDAGAGRVY